MNSIIEQIKSELIDFSTWPNQKDITKEDWKQMVEEYKKDLEEDDDGNDCIIWTLDEDDYDGNAGDGEDDTLDILDAITMMYDNQGDCTISGGFVMNKKEPVVYNPEDFNEQKVSIISELKGSLKGLIPDGITDKEIRSRRLEDRRKKYENLS